MCSPCSLPLSVYQKQDVVFPYSNVKIIQTDSFEYRNHLHFLAEENLRAKLAYSQWSVWNI